MAGHRQTFLQKNLSIRAQILHAIRRFFIDNAYLEVETPCRIAAPAPEAHIEAEVSEDWFLQTSPELCMKRLLAAGYPRIFQICKCFRKAERGNKHLPELTMLEWYSAGHNYLDMMGQCEQLLRYILQDLDSGESITYQGENIEFRPPWSRLSVSEAFEKHASMPLREALLEDRFDETMVADLEPRLGHNPVFLYDYPACRGALARLKPENPSLAERFELHIGGLELCNGFSELTDPLEQRARFEKEQSFRQSSGRTAYPMPEKFLNALHDMPEAAGNALGIDRLVMLFADTNKIDDVVTFLPEEL